MRHTLSSSIQKDLRVPSRPAHLEHRQLTSGRPPPSGSAKTPILQRNPLSPQFCADQPHRLSSSLNWVTFSPDEMCLLCGPPPWSPWLHIEAGTPAPPADGGPPVECSPRALGCAVFEARVFPTGLCAPRGAHPFLRPQRCPRPTRRPAAGPRGAR